MDKVKKILEVVQGLLKVVEDIRSLADSVQSVCTVITDCVSVQEEVPKLPDKAEEQKEPEITLEQVRAVLGEKSKAGHTDEVRELLEKYGADRLSNVDPKNYAAIIKDAEVL